MVKSRREASSSARAEGDAVGMAAVAVGGVAAEGGHFDHAGRLRPDHRDHAEGGADGQRAAAAEQRADLSGMALVATS